MDKEEYLDLDKKYRGTFIQFRTKGTEAWQTCYVESISGVENPEEDGFNFQVVGHDKDKHPVVFTNVEKEIDFSFPPVGVLEHKNTVVIGNKYPARQWKKALTVENFKVYLPLAKLVKNIGDIYILKGAVKDIKWTTSEVQDWFSTRYIAFEEALALIKSNKKHAVPLSNQFFVSASHYGEGYLVWRRSKIVAEVSLTGEVAYICKSFEQELKDFFNRSKHA